MSNTLLSAPNAFAANEDYNIKRGIVFSNERLVQTKGIITYLPIYYVMFVEHRVPEKLVI